MDGGCLPAAIKKAGLNLIYLLSDLAFAPQVMLSEYQQEGGRRKRTKTMNPFSQGRF